MNYDKTIAFAKSINAKVTIPLDPKRPRKMDEPADVQKTWSLYRPAEDFDNVPSLRRKQA